MKSQYYVDIFTFVSDFVMRRKKKPENKANTIFYQTA